MYIVYKTTNKINGKFYIGFTGRSDPSYLGSGYLIRKAVAKYGRDSFVRETLFQTDCRVEALEKEKETIEGLLHLDSCYNIAEGGLGGNTGNLEELHKGNLGNQYRKGHKHSEETKIRMSLNRKGSNHPRWNKWSQRNHAKFLGVSRTLTLKLLGYEQRN